MRVTTSSIRIEASREIVWAVLTDHAYVKQWQYGSVLSTDWSVDSPIRFANDWEGNTFEQWGTVLLVDAPAQLRYSMFAPRPDLEDKPENYFTMGYTLEDAAGKTNLTITLEDPREITGEDTGDNDEENPVLATLKNLAESVAANAPGRH
ncbi:ATPase [Kribbella qitaiheensis]|uniref:ATPase n=2 Tax=Kribbella qitaiheensis TaxID=1544730 RepID=A0A7G6XAN7_9ACTN|nr:ATPase [Kribbella qitaiheensis]